MKSPAADLDQRKLPLKIIKGGTVFWRIHRHEHAPVFFGPLALAPPLNRFDAPGGEYRVCYLGLSFDVALIETLLRDPARRLVDPADIRMRSVSTLEFKTYIEVVDLTGPGLSQLGATAELLSTGDYAMSRIWARALWSHPSAPDGVIYRSRHDPSEVCLALFDRPSLSIGKLSTIALDECVARVHAVLRRYGKALI